MHGEKARAKISIGLKRQWKDPEYRAKVSEAVKEQWKDPKLRAKMSAASREWWGRKSEGDSANNIRPLPFHFENSYTPF